MGKQNRFRQYIDKVVYSLLEDIFVETVFAFFVLLSTVTITAWLVLNQGSLVDISLKVMRYLVYMICLAVIVAMIYKKKYSCEAIFFFAFFVICAGISSVVCGERGVLISSFLLAAIYGRKGEKLIKVSFGIQGAILIITIILAWAGVTDNSLVDSERMRYSLGFSWTSFAPNLFLFLCLQYIYLKRKLNWIDYLVLEVVNTCLYIFTNTRMSFLLVTLFLCAHAICAFFVPIRTRIQNNLSRFEKAICLSPIIGAALAIILPLYKTGGKVWELLNTGFSGRMWQSKSGIINYGFTLFGQVLDVEGFSVGGVLGGDSDYIDSSYLQICLNYGIVILVFVLVIYIFAFQKAYFDHDYTLISILILVVIFSIEDPFLFDFRFNIFPILAFCDADVFRSSSILSKGCEKVFDVKIKFIDNKRLKSK